MRDSRTGSFTPVLHGKASPSAASSGNLGRHSGQETIVGGFPTVLGSWSESLQSGDRVSTQNFDARLVRIVVCSQELFFARAIRDVHRARAQATDCRRFLRPLISPVHQLEAGMQEPRTFVDILRGIVQRIYLVWKHSKHFNTPVLIANMFRKVCNSIRLGTWKYVERVVHDATGGTTSNELFNVVKFGPPLNVSLPL